MRIKHPKPGLVRYQPPRMEVSPERKVLGRGKPASKRTSDESVKVTVKDVRSNKYRTTLVTDKGDFVLGYGDALESSVMSVNPGQKARIFYRGWSLLGICIY